MEFQKAIGILLLIILAIALFLRLYNIDKKSYGLDEEYSIGLALLPIKHLLIHPELDTHPPFYYIFLHYWIKLFGETEKSTRSLSVVFGVATIFIIYRLGTFLFNREVGIISSAIMAVSPFHIRYSQETRMYSLMVMLAVISMYFFSRIMKEKTNRPIIFYIISSILLIYTHIFGLFILIVQNIYIITFQIFCKKPIINFRKWVLLQFIIIIMFIPWIIVLIGKITQIQTGIFKNINWLTPPSIQRLFDTLINYASSSFNLLLFLIFSLISIISYKYKNKFQEFTKNYLLILCFFVPILVPFIISVTILPVYSEKYTIAASVPLYILVANGVGKIKSRTKKWIVFLMIITLSLSGLASYYQQKDFEPWRKATNYIDQMANKGDLVIVIPNYAKNNFIRYSTRRDITVEGERDIIEYDPERVWFVVRYIELNRSTNNYALIEKEKFEGITAYLFQKQNFGR